MPVSPTTLTQLDSGGANKLAIDASGRLTLVPTQSVELLDSAGTNKLAIDASGRLTLVPNSSVNTAQIGGQAPTLDNTSIQAVSLRGKGTVAGDTPLLVETYDNFAGVAITEDLIRNAILAGKSFSYFTGKQTGVAGTMGFQVLNNNQAKDLYIYSIIILLAAAGFIDVRMTTANVNTITGWTDSVITPVNNKGGGGASIMTSSFSNTNVTGGLLGTSRSLANATANQQAELLTNGTGILLPKSAVNGIAMYLTLAGATVWSVAAYGIEV